MSDAAIRVLGLSKRYRIRPRERYKALRDVLSGAMVAPFRALGLSRNGHVSGLTGSVAGGRWEGGEPETIWALKDVSFEVRRGEVVGIIGRNGAGKSTLLKILSRITEPTEGEVEVRGRVGSLLEVGTGFHPELTGRENIYLNGAILGMKKGEIDRKFDEIVAFAEVEKFIDTPVKYYSSGMYVRLAFAVAAHLEPEILLVDEVLAVGDAAFQKKCLGKMGDVAREGRTVLFVSHNMAAIVNLCQKAMLLVNGRQHLWGKPDVVVAHYLRAAATHAQRRWEGDLRPGDETIRLLAVSIVDKNGEITDSIGMETEFSVEIEYEIAKPTRGLQVGFRLVTSDGTVVLTSGDTDNRPDEETERRPGHYLSRCTIPAGLLSPQTYYFSFGAHAPNIRVHFFVEDAIALTIVRTQPRGSIADDKRQGIICPVLPWRISQIGGNGS